MKNNLYFRVPLQTMYWSVRASLLLSVSVSLSLCLDSSAPAAASAAQPAAAASEDGAKVRQKRFIHWGSEPGAGAADEAGWGAVEGVPQGEDGEAQEEGLAAGERKKHGVVLLCMSSTITV